MISKRTRLLAGVAVLVIAVLAWIAVTEWPASAQTPYADPAVIGTITLYDASGHVMTHGNVHTAPFVARAVSSVSAPPPYNLPGETATLLAFQPREGAVATAWSGDTLTASTPYADAAHPTATASASDFSLADFLSEFPPRWDGAVQLRIYLDAPGQTARTTSYVAADIRVTGDTWTLVSGGGSSR